ncbi:MAG: hypothetical protein ACSHW7_11585 [Patiriisocius sp.]|uniref:hypothetical protein n=1 Tax=Patiriisocius sp. TaxID=2822396 RepID=UPI003EF77D33
MYENLFKLGWNERWEILALLVFRALELERWQKPKVLKYAAGSMKHNGLVYEK